MKTFRSTETVAAETVATALDALRAHGLRVSTSRRMVLEALVTAGAPVSAERIATGLGGRLPPLDPASVYRNLDTLEQLGVVRHFHAGHGPGLYTLAGPRPCEYLVCDDCGALRPVGSGTLDPVRASLREATGWEARFDHFPIVGRCPACAERSAQASRHA
jgi:Fur family transcriptional regulator, ferric uptake regulator